MIGTRRVARTAPVAGPHDASHGDAARPATRCSRLHRPRSAPARACATACRRAGRASPSEVSSFGATPGDDRLAVLAGVVEPKPLGSEAWPASIASLTSTVASALPRAVVTRARPPSTSPRRVGVLGADPQRAVGVALAPARVADDVVGGVGAALAGGQHERELVARSSAAGPSSSARELGEQLGDLERDPLVGRARRSSKSSS